ncbi:MAG: ComEC/Rec2 family competence protein [Paludibacter sp.]
MDFLQRTPFFRLLLPFIIGIIAYRFVEFPSWGLWAIIGLSLVLVILSIGIRIPKLQYQFRWLFGCGIFLFLFSLGYVLSSENEKSTTFDQLHQKGIYRIDICSPPVEKAKSIMCKANVLEFYNSKWQPTHGQAILYFQKDKIASRLLFGDRLMVEAEFTPIEKPLNPDAFDYATYLKRQGIGATSYISTGSWQITGHSSAFSIRREADKWRNYLLAIFKKFKIQGDEFAVLAALTLGYTDDLQPDIRAGYSATGTVHILSVSGMHVAVVYIVLMFLLKFLDKSLKTKILKTIIVISFLWGYAFLSGMSAAVIRAAVMFTFVAFAFCLERKSQIYNTLFMSAFAMLVVNPNFLYDVGFQLSYAAVLSIIFFQPIVDKLYKPTNKISRFTWEMISVSVAAQLGTTPFTLYYFQQFPNYFLITNLIAIPVSTWIIYGAIGLFFVSWIPYLSEWMGFILKWLVWFLNHFIVFVQNLPYSVWQISINLYQSIFFFLAIFCLSGYYFSKKFAPLFVGLSALLITCLLSIQQNVQTLSGKRIIVYAGQKNLHVSFINHDKNFVYSTDSTEIERIAKTYWHEQKFENPVFLNKTNWFVDGFGCFEGNKVLILRDDFLKKKTTQTPIKLDYLVIGNRLKPKISQILDCVHPRKIIVDKSISRWYTDDIRKTCKTRNIGFYSIAEQGAFMLNIKD